MDTTDSRKSSSAIASAEATAYALLLDIAAAEGKSTRHFNTDGKMADRNWLLRNYRECLRAVLRARKTEGLTK